MRFAWTDDQLAVRDAVRELLDKECDPRGPFDRGVWTSLDGMGVLSVLAPEADGGLGLDECWLVPVLEETGRAALPHPVVETALVAAPLGITGRMVTAAFGPDRAPTATDADAALVERGGSLFLVEPVDAVGVDAVDPNRRLGAVRGTGTLVTDDPAVVSLAFDRGVLGTAAQLVGLSWAMLDRAVAHVTDRHQFGVPVGSFQAVKHHLANARIAIEFAAPAVARAAWSTSTGQPTRGREVSMAKVLATDAATKTGRAALQCHGAIGYTVEHDLHLYLKRSWALARSWGDRSFHADRVGRSIGV